MTDINDLYEPGDDREPKPDERDEQPVDLAEVEDAYQVVFPKVAWLGSSGERLVAAIPLLIAELLEARQRIAEFEALPTREEWTVTESASRPPRSTDRSVWGGTAEMVADYAAKHGAQMWRRMVSEHPAEPIDLDAPF